MRTILRRFLMQRKIVLIMTLMSVCLIGGAVEVRQNNEEDVKVSGKVVDENGSGLPGATVLVKGTTLGTTTDMDGAFSLMVPEDAVISVSFIGFKVKEIPLNGRTFIEIEMEPDLGDLDEVVVVGYSTQSKASLTSSVASIGNENIQTTNHTSLAQKLQGKVAGLQIRQTSGQPGVFDNDINIRGFNGSPLYVIDGIRREGSTEFQQLNAEDIESISVLKDAAASIYGLGAQNGVILVTTKKGSKGKPKFSFGVNYGVLTPTNIPDMADAGQYTEMWNDAFIFQRGGDGSPRYSKEYVDNWVTGAPGFESTDWYDLTMKDRSNFQQYNASVNGGSDKITYYMGFEHMRENGLLKSGDMGYQRFNLRSNVTAKLTDNLESQLLLGVRHSTRTQPGAGFFSIFKGTRVSLPTDYPYANGNPEYIRPTYLDQNPLALADRDITGYSEDRTQSLQSSFSLKYTAPFLEGLSFKGVFSYDLNNFQNKNLNKPYSLYNYDSIADRYVPVKYRDGSGSMSQRARLNQYLTFQGYVNFDRKFGKHKVGTVLVYEINTLNREDFNGRGIYGDFYTTDVLEFATDQEFVGSSPRQEADISYIGRLNYSYADKYLFEVAARYQGHYNYAPSNRWGLFPMASVGWRVSEESFIRDNVSFLSDLKLRASIGTVGQPVGSPFQYIQGYVVGSGGPYEFIDDTQVFGIAAPEPANAKLSWADVTTTNLALDLGVLDNTFTLTTEVYQRFQDGLPAKRNVSLTDTYGGGLPEENLNQRITRGLEFVLGHKNSVGDLSYSVNVNYNLARTMWLHREGEAYTNSYDEWRNRREDRWEGIIWAQNYIGPFTSADELRNSALQNGSDGNITRALPGDFRYEDVNGDGVIDGDDRSPILSDGTPRTNFGLNLDLFWKGFDFNMLLQGQTGHTLKFDEVYGQIFAFRGNTPAYFHDRWRKEDPYNLDSEWIPGEWPVSRAIGDMPGNSYTESSVWRRDASFLRLKSLQLGYTFKSDIISKVGISSMRIYATGFNLLTFTDPWVKPHDPERSNNGPGLGYNAGFGYPLAKTYTVGLSINL